MEFLENYLKLISQNLANYYEDNWDALRYGRLKKEGLKTKVANKASNLIHKRGYFKISWLVQNFPSLKKFEYLYDHLATAADQALLLKVIAFRFFGHRKIKLPLSTPDYFQKVDSLASLQNPQDKLSVTATGQVLHKMDLSSLGFPINLYYENMGLMATYIVKQYEYIGDGKTIKAEKGNYVIDAGGCFGDTALYFANEVGTGGKVFSFEFVPENMAIFKKNVALNSTLSDVIELVPRPVWKDSETNITIQPNGPGTSVAFKNGTNSEHTCTSISIDDFIRSNNIPHINFIKMDVEGAETDALKGAIETIVKFKPKLAIALYHSDNDFETIPKFIKQLVPEYKLYFSHATIHREESILFASME